MKMSAGTRKSFAFLGKGAPRGEMSFCFIHKQNDKKEEV